MVARPRARRTSPLYLPSAIDLFKPSRDLFMQHLDVFGALYIVPLILWLHSWVDTPAHGGSFWNRGTDANYGWTFPAGFNAAIIGFSILWFLIAIAASAIAQIMLQRSQLDAVEGRQPSVSRAWEFLKSRGWKLFQLYVVMVLIIIAGLVLLIIPGLFMIRRYIFAPYVMIDKDCDIKEALEESHRLGLTNTGAVWGLMGVMFLISLIGILPIFGSLISFVLGALYSIAPAIRYQQLKKLA